MSIVKQAFHGKRLALVGLLAVAIVTGALWYHSPLTAQDGSQGPRVSAQQEAAIDHANNLSLAFRKAAEAIVPTVVTIETRTNVRAVRGNRGIRGENPFRGTPFEEFFNEDMLPDADSLRRFAPRQSGTGSGVIIDSTGLIMTNNHVVEGADEVLVRLSDGREFPARDVKTDPQTDLAVLRIDGAGSLPAARFGNSDALEIGDWVIAVGNPFGLESTVSAGIISGKGRELATAGNRARFLQTDAAINPGNSGGPLVNLAGQVIGINTAIASSSGGYQGVGFAVPANLARWVTEQLVKTGSVQRAYLGVGIGELNTELAEQFGVERRAGVLVAEVYPNSPAADAKLREGDVIVEFAGVPVATPRDLQETVERTQLGSKQIARVLRDGKLTDVTVVPKAMPSDFDRAAAGQPDRSRGGTPSEGYFNEAVGIEVRDLTADQASQLGFENFTGVLVTEVDPAGIAAEKGLREGMLIREVNRQPVGNLAEFRKAMEKASVDEGVLLLVRTAAGNRFVVLKSR